MVNFIGKRINLLRKLSRPILNRFDYLVELNFLDETKRLEINEAKAGEFSQFLRGIRLISKTIYHVENPEDLHRFIVSLPYK